MTVVPMLVLLLAGAPGEEQPAGAAAALAPRAADRAPLADQPMSWRSGVSLRDPTRPPEREPEPKDGPFDLGDGWTLDLGGQERLRFQRESNRALGGPGPRVNDFLLHRLRVWADVRHDSGWRFHVEAIDARIAGNERAPLPIDRNDADLRNAYAEVVAGDTALRLGRTDLQYGAQRLISPLEWGNTRRTFEGAVVRQELDGGSVDLFVTRPVVVDVHDGDHDDASLWFSGVYSSWEMGEEGGLDVYGLALNETTDKLAGSAGQLGSLDLYTVGARAWHAEGGLDLEAEVATQFGQRARDDVDAAMFTARAGYTWAQAPWTPRLGLDLDWASGDPDPTDGDVETFNQLFPLGHAWLGHLDLVARSNVVALSPSLAVKPDDRTTLRAAFHRFRLQEKKDAFYNAGGAAVLADPTGRAGDNVGTEWNLTAARNVKDELRFVDHVLLGFAHFTPGRFVSSQRNGDRTSLLYLQLTKGF